jgi:GT2 family glycosyltransferase
LQEVITWASAGLKNGADFVWLLNNDTVVEKNSLTSLIDACELIVGVVGSKIYFAPGREYLKTIWAH